MKKHLYAFVWCLCATFTGWAQPQYSLPHGLYNQDVLEIGITPMNNDTEVRYTTDGSIPTPNSLLYTAPLILKKTTLLRAVEVKDGELMSPVTTASYIFMESVMNQSNTPEGYPTEWGKYTDLAGRAIADYEMDPEMTNDKVLRPKIMEGLYDLPILSIVTDKDNLFSHENDTARGGIYIFTGPPVGDDTGHGWTRPASAELIGGPQGHDMQIDCGVRLHGGHGRLAEKNPKHSFRLVFKKEYGPGTLEYPLFGENEPDKFNQLVLRCHFGNSWQHWGGWGNTKAQFTRDVWARRMQRRMGHPAVNALHVHLFLNGMYWGLYNIAERIDDQFGKEYLGGKKSDYDVIKVEESGGVGIEASEGDMIAWKEMLATVNKAADDAFYYRLQGLDAEGMPDTTEALLDIDGFIDYMLINQYGGNTDWDHHNWYAIRKRGVDTKGFHFLCWDTEQIFEGLYDNNLSTNNHHNPTWIFHTLLQNKKFVNRYLKRAKQMLSEDGFLGESSVVELWDSLYQVVSKAVYVESARWGDYRRDVHQYNGGSYPLYTVDEHFMSERNRLLTDYFPKRSDVALSNINTYVQNLTGFYFDDWEVPSHWIPMTASMFHEWDGTGVDAQPKDKNINVDWKLNMSVGGGDAVMMSVTVAYNQYADLTPYETLVLRGTGNGLRIIANRLVDHGPYKQVVISFNENSPYWNADWQAIFLPIKDIAKAFTNEGAERDDDFVHVNALKVEFGGSGVNLRNAYLIPCVPQGMNPTKTELRPNDGIYYNLMGQPVMKPTKGIYIRNGHKVVIK